MKFQKSIQTVDAHTAGEPTRIVTGGIPHLPGQSMPEKKAFLEKHMDHVRRGLMHEPRGHRDMFGAVLTAPVSAAADAGIIFMDGGGYLNMCGHGLIGAVTVLLETGILPMRPPSTAVVLETPAGLVHARAGIEAQKVTEVSFKNVPAFLYKRDVNIDVPEVGRPVCLDIAFGGSFFAIASAKSLGIRIAPDQLHRLIGMALAIRDCINTTIEIRHPHLPHITTVDLVEIYDEPTHPEAHLKNVVVFGQGQVDRSPCGTGTCAKIATLYSKGKLQQGESFVYESVLGTLFSARITGETRVGRFAAVIPEITASAYITGFNHFVFDDADPLMYGFVLI